jgi:hypothetical protein
LSEEELPKVESTEIATAPPRNPGGAPKGNKNSVRSGITGLRRMRKSGKLDKRTSFGKAFESRRAEYVAHLGGDQLSAMELAIIEDTVWTDFYTTAYDVYLSNLKSVITKGRPHCLVDARTKLAAHRRGNLMALGLERRAKQPLTVDDIKARYEDGGGNPGDDQKGNEK